jgi:SRSO17 transposase
MSTPRVPVTTLSFVDHYCAMYEDLFPDVRSLERFKLLHVGLIAEIPRKSLPAIAKAVDLSNGQALHHFLSDSPWNIEAFRDRRLLLLKQALQGRSFILCIDKRATRRRVKQQIMWHASILANWGRSTRASCR